MRIWSLHPQYLDSKGLVALWRETLLAKHVLEGKTKGYKNHPQLLRFKNTKNPLGYINRYLSMVYKESVKRGFYFDKSKFEAINFDSKLTVSTGQINFEMQHLLKKLKIRDKKLFEKYKNISQIQPNAIFTIISGEIAAWEVV